MGVMFLVLTPCLYCNVSDSWMLPNKWHRAWIGAAGMYVEIVIASICTFLWWFSEPGLLHQLCLSTMFVCSVSTVMFNANPLLALRRLLHPVRPDRDSQPAAKGHARSSTASWAPGAWAWKSPTIRSCRSATRCSSPLYTVAAAVYRWLILFGILWFLYKVFEPYGLKVISQMLAIDFDREPGRHAAVESGQVLLRPRKARQSETQERQHHVGDPGCRGPVRHVLSRCPIA